MVRSPQNGMDFWLKVSSQSHFFSEWHRFLAGKYNYIVEYPQIEMDFWLESII